MKPFRWQARIRFADTDASQRIHYTAMFRHFEASEQEFLHALGCPYTSHEHRDFGFPRVHVECDFQSEIRYDDLVDIDVTVDRVGTSSFTLAFAAGVAGRNAAKGKVTVVCLDRHTERSTPLPARLAEALRRYLA
ncbi:MAG: acyl-CoA thioesterase [Acidobacteria bacterium]|nr:acyl-CoA thioesterase [Acidobacteriota bacterium]